MDSPLNLLHTWLALYNGIIKPEFDSGDGVHLNDAAHKILFERVQFSGVGLAKYWMLLLHPQDGAILTGTKEIVWSQEIVPDTIPLTTIDFSSDGGIRWEQILNTVSDNTTYLWDTSPHPDGTRYLLPVSCGSSWSWE
jgi:hypothetical protein